MRVDGLPCCRPRCRGVAQPGRAPGSGPGGRRFKSSLPDQSFQALKLHFWFSVYIDGVEIVDGRVFLDFPLGFQRELHSDLPARTRISLPRGNIDGGSLPISATRSLRLTADKPAPLRTAWPLTCSWVTACRRCASKQMPRRHQAQSTSRLVDTEIPPRRGVLKELPADD